MGDYRKAIERLHQAIKLRPDYAAAHATLGRVYLKSGNYEDAIVSLERALQLKLNTNVVLNDLGCAYARLKKYKEARAFLQHAITISPDFAAAFLNLGVVNFNLHDREATLRQYAVLKRLDSAMAEKLYAMLYREKILQVSEAAIAPRETAR
jgi:tetratricopeptide (TPR) repeat protein